MTEQPAWLARYGFVLGPKRAGREDMEHIAEYLAIVGFEIDRLNVELETLRQEKDTRMPTGDGK